MSDDYMFEEYRRRKRRLLKRFLIAAPALLAGMGLAYLIVATWGPRKGGYAFGVLAAGVIGYTLILLSAAVRCPACDARVLRWSASYCPSCGRRLTPP